MQQDFAPFFRSYDNQRYIFNMYDPYYFSIDERIVTTNWDSEEPHWHNYFEIEIILDGEGMHLCNGTSSKIDRGCIYLISPSDIHAVIPNVDSPLKLIHIGFDERSISEKVLHMISQYNYVLSIELEEGPFQDIILNLKELLTCTKSPALFRDIRISLILTYICVCILQESDWQSNHLPSSTNSDSPIQQTASYIRYNFRKKISMEDLALQAHLSPNHLSVLFKNETGLTCMQLISQLRMKHALNLLKNTNLSIKVISEESGFSSVSYFISIFQKEFTLTPKAYQRKHYKA